MEKCELETVEMLLNNRKIPKSHIL